MRKTLHKVTRGENKTLQIGDLQYGVAVSVNMHGWIWHNEELDLWPTCLFLSIKISRAARWTRPIVYLIIFNHSEVYCTQDFLSYYWSADPPPERRTIVLTSWDKWDPLTFRGERSESVGGRTDPMLGPLSLNVTDWLRRQTEIAANSGSISSQDYCLVNECFLLSPVSQPWCVHLCWGLSFPHVFIDRAYLPC